MALYVIAERLVVRSVTLFRRALLQLYRCAAVALILTLAGLTPASGQQLVYSGGQTVAPAFEGWEQNPDGSYNMVFGYFNRNLDEHLHVPIGPDNNLEPGGPDRGQPTYFFPRRNRFHFKVRVPADFGDKELVWTLTTHGHTEKAYATLIPEYIIDKQLPMLDVGNFGRDPEGHDLLNEPPTVTLEGAAEHMVVVGDAAAFGGRRRRRWDTRAAPGIPRGPGIAARAEQRPRAPCGLGRLSRRRGARDVRSAAVQDLSGLPAQQQLALVAWLGDAGAAGGRRVAGHRHVQRAG